MMLAKWPAHCGGHFLWASSFGGIYHPGVLCERRSGRVTVIRRSVLVLQRWVLEFTDARGRCPVTRDDPKHAVRSIVRCWPALGDGCPLYRRRPPPEWPGNCE